MRLVKEQASSLASWAQCSSCWYGDLSRAAARSAARILEAGPLLGPFSRCVADITRAPYRRSAPSSIHSCKIKRPYRLYRHRHARFNGWTEVGSCNSRLLAANRTHSYLGSFRCAGGRHSRRGLFFSKPHRDEKIVSACPRCLHDKVASHPTCRRFHKVRLHGGAVISFQHLTSPSPW